MLNALTHKHEPEAREHQAGQPDNCCVMQLTRSDAWESQHTYYDICPWSHDGRFLLFSSVPVDAAWAEFGHDTLACDKGRVQVMDTQTFETWDVMDDVLYIKHGGAFCMWHPTEYKVYYRKTADNCAALDLTTGEETLLPPRLRQLSPDGQVFSLTTRPVHGGGQGAGAGSMPACGGDVCELVGRETLHELTPNRDEFAPEDMRLGNLKWRPGSQHLLIAMWVYPYPESHRSLYVVGRDGSDPRWLCHFGGHHSWTPDGERVLFVDHREGEHATGQGRFLHTVDFDGSNRKCIFDHPAGSHPLMHPDNNHVVDFNREHVYVAHLDQQRIEVLAEFSQAFEQNHHGIHPHPVWSHAGDQVLYNSAETGHGEIYRIAW